MPSVITPDSTGVGQPGSSGTGGEPSRQPGNHPGNFALLLLLGVPIAAVVLVFWQFVVQTSGEINENERIVGWSAVLRDLPAMLLLFVPVVAGLALGIRSARLGSRRGIVAICLHWSLLFLLLLGAAASTDSVITTVEWVLYPAGAIAVLLLCLRAARRRPLGSRMAGPPDRRPFAGRVRLAAALPIAGIAGAFIWLFAAQAALSAHADGFVRASIPAIGQIRVVTLPANHAGTYYLYVEASDVNTLGDLPVQVTDPGGQVVPVQAMTPRAEYLHDWRGGRAVGTFDATRAGDYRVAVTGTQPPSTAPYAPSNPWGDFAVGDGVANWMRPHESGSAALLFVTVASSVVLAVVTAIQRRRSQAA